MAERQLVVFQIGTEVYGLDIRRVWEIIIPDRITRVPGMPDYMDGIIDLRGAVVPIVDMRKRFQAADTAGAGRILITDVGQSPIGLRVDSVGRVVRLDERSFKQPPRMLTGMGAPFVSAICDRPESHGGGLILLLDVEKLFSQDEISAIHAVR